MTEIVCQARHKFWWVFPTVICTVLSIFAAAVWTSLEKSQHAEAMTNSFEIKLVEKIGEVDAKVTQQQQKVQDNWDAGQRQLTAIRTDIGEIKSNMREDSKAIADQLRANHELLVNALAKPK